MKRLMHSLAAAALASLGSGCAYLTTYTRSIDLQGTNSVAMDVKQRVVISQRRPGDAGPSGESKEPTTTVVCAEPSPDALTVLGASGGLSFSDGLAEKSANLSAALSESGAFVGLRTQSIQLLRDAMYRLCEGYAGRAVDGDEFASMQRRYQSTMMGLIAIEQLTRPVVAGQAALASSATASAGAGAGDAAVKAAQEDVDKKQAAADEAREAATRAEAAQREAQQKVDANLSSLKAAEAKKDPSVDSLKAEAATLAKTRDDAQLESHIAKDKQRAADEALRRAKSALTTARTASSASAAGTAQLGGIGKAVTDSTAELAEGVTDIVKEINYSYTREGCLTLVTQLARGDSSKPPPLVTYMKSSRSGAATAGAGGAPEKLDMVSATFDMCKEVILSSVERWNAAATRKLSDAEARKAEAETKLIEARAKERAATASEEVPAAGQGKADSAKKPAAAPKAASAPK